MTKSTSTIRKPIGSYLAPFDRLSYNLTTLKSITPADLVPFSSLQWPGQEQLELGLKNGDRGTACSVLQLMMGLFISEPGWNIGCVVPGMAVVNHPSAGVINLMGPKQENILAGQWAIFPYKQDGIRTRMQIKACLPARDPAYWRAFVTHWSVIWNSLSINHVEREERLNAIYNAAIALGEKNPAPLRYLVKDAGIYEDADSLASIMFGTGWDLLTLISRVPKAVVSGGAWNFPDSSAREIRCRALIYQDAAQLYFQPAVLDIEAMHLNVMHWVLSGSDVSLKNQVNRAMETLKLAYYLWNSKCAAYISRQFFQKEIVAGKSPEKLLASALAGSKAIFISPLTLTEAKKWLIERGHYDWVQRLAKVCTEKPPPPTVQVEGDLQEEKKSVLQPGPGNTYRNGKIDKLRDKNLIRIWIVSFFIIAISALIWFEVSTVKHEAEYLRETLHLLDIEKGHSVQLLKLSSSIEKMEQEVRYLTIRELLKSDVRVNWLDIVIQQGNNGEILLKGEVPTIYLKTLIKRLIGHLKEVNKKINIDEIKVTSFYVVQSRDNLSRIAEKVYGDSNQWRKIYDANRKKISDSSKIQENLTLIIPDCPEK